MVRSFHHRGPEIAQRHREERMSLAQAFRGVSEPRAVATGSGSLLESTTKPRGERIRANRAEMNFSVLLDPVATARGSDTPCLRLGDSRGAS